MFLLPIIVDSFLMLSVKRALGFALLIVAFGAGTLQAQPRGDAKATAPTAKEAARAELTASSASAVRGQRVACENGMAGVYPCDNVDLLAYVPIADLGGASTGNDIWGWTDPQTGREYAIFGLREGTSFVDISDPVHPIYLGTLPTHAGLTSLWRDMKVYADHAYIVSEARGETEGHGLQVFDLTQLRDVTEPPVTFEETAHYDRFERAHNIVINEDTGFAYVVGIQGEQDVPIAGCGPGLHMIDINDPAAPEFAGCFNSTVGRGYTHDAQCVVYHGPDADYTGQEICVLADEDGIAIVDVTDKAEPVEVATATYPQADEGYAHQGWFTEDQQYFFLDDEFDELKNLVSGTRTIVWDMAELDDPIVHFEHIADRPCDDHNQYIKGTYVYQANYRCGLRILDISEVENKVLTDVAFFDTYPADDESRSSAMWSVYPFFESGVLIASDYSGEYRGLYVLEMTDTSVASEPTRTPPATFVLSAAYPNPFNPTTTVTLTVHEAQPVSVAVFDAQGREVARLHDGALPTGTATFTVEAADLPSGTYWVRATGAEGVSAKAVTLLK
jgi:choice-of-anchor B domain-containing protein